MIQQLFVDVIAFCVLRFRHPNLLTLMGYCMLEDNFCLVYEFMSNGTLEDALANSVCLCIVIT